METEKKEKTTQTRPKLSLAPNAIQTKFYTLEYLGFNYNISLRSLRREITNGNLRASKIFNKFFVTEEDFLAYLKKNKV